MHQRLDHITRFVYELEVGTVNIWEVPGYRTEMSPVRRIKEFRTRLKEGVLEAMQGLHQRSTYSLPWPSDSAERRPKARDEDEKAEVEDRSGHGEEKKMRAQVLTFAAGPAAGGRRCPPGLAGAAEGSVTIYGADGLHDGKGSWVQTQFDAFTKATGIKVQYVEGGSGGVVERVDKEKSNPQADVLVTLPPFIQKAAADGLLQPYKPARRRHDRRRATRTRKPAYDAIGQQLPGLHLQRRQLEAAAEAFDDLLDPKFKSKIQYSTPGQAGDGTAVMLQVVHAFGSKEPAFEYLKKLQANNVGPSASTGKLTALVNKGEICVANGDVQMNMSQMNDNPNISVFWPAGPNGKRSTLPLPYDVGLVTGAPDADNGKKLIEFLLSKEAQSAVSSVAHRPAGAQGRTPTDANFTKLHDAMQGVKIWTPDWAQVLEGAARGRRRWHASDRKLR